MKLLLDENLPHRLRPLIVGHEVFTVSFLKWKGIENGALLAKAAANGFDAVIPKDTGIEREQNRDNLPCALVFLRAKSNSLRDVQPLVPELLAALQRLKPRTVTRIG